MRWLILAVMCGCPSPPVQPHPDASDAALYGDAPDVCTRACSNLAQLGCIEGADVHCVEACAKNISVPTIAVPAACWADAGTKEVARACGVPVCE